MTIWDLEDLDPEDAFARAKATISKFPILARVFDDDFLRDLIRRRATIVDNFLLFVLVQPEGEIAIEIWREITDDLLLLEPEGSIEAFADKLKRHTSAEFEATRSEIALPAWFKRNGTAVVLEPPVGDKRPDFAASTEPPTTWEIKSLQDIDDVQTVAAIEHDVQGRLRKASQPYILTTTGLPQRREDVARAVKAIVRGLVAHDQAGLPVPHTFEDRGLVVTAERRQRDGKGYPGIFTGPMHEFGTEYSERVRGRIKAAGDQLPTDSAGVVVIDCTATTWLDDEEVIDACFGDLSTVFRGRETFDFRENGAFREGGGTRISAVIAYARRRHISDTGPFKMTVLHNPYARFPLPDGWLSDENVRHIRRVEETPGKYRFDITPSKPPVGDGAPE
jgi:hypothetical protein